MNRTVCCGLLAVMVMLTAGCAGLPAPETAEDTMLVIPVFLDKSTGGQTYGKYRIDIELLGVYGVVERVLLAPTTSWEIVTGLPPGEYVITSRTFIYDDTRKEGSTAKVGRVFDLEPGAVTVLPHVALYSFQEANLSGTRLSMWIEFPPITGDQAMTVMEKLQRKGTFENWRLSGHSLKYPEFRDAAENLGL